MLWDLGCHHTQGELCSSQCHTTYSQYKFAADQLKRHAESVAPVLRLPRSHSTIGEVSSRGADLVSRTGGPPTRVWDYHQTAMWTGMSRSHQSVSVWVCTLWKIFPPASSGKEPTEVALQVTKSLDPRRPITASDVVRAVCKVSTQWSEEERWEKRVAAYRTHAQWQPADCRTRFL